MRNLYKEFNALTIEHPLQIGIVTNISNGISTIQLPSGEEITARGANSNLLNTTVFVKGDVIQGIAPSLPVSIIEI